MIKLCKLILYQNNDYTNVDFIGLLVSTLALLLLCIFSFGVEIISIFRFLTKKFVHGYEALTSIIRRLGDKFAEACLKVWKELV